MLHQVVGVLYLAGGRRVARPLCLQTLLHFKADRGLGASSRPKRQSPHTCRDRGLLPVLWPLRPFDDILPSSLWSPIRQALKPTPTGPPLLAFGQVVRSQASANPITSCRRPIRLEKISVTRCGCNTVRGTEYRYAHIISHEYDHIYLTLRQSIPDYIDIICRSFSYHFSSYTSP